ncbi:MAG: chemotaxis protein CheW [Hydrococcus sp. C42_A2020_068]|nr:chemotaxis protein CheW [Hydrococcus sp. C42_A2020_068]
MTEKAEGAAIATPPSGSRFILAQLDRLTLVFPANLVAETLLIDRSQILPMPFYPSVVLGCIHHAGQLVPLVATDALFGISSPLTKERLTVVRLGEQAQKFAGVGLVVDRLLSSQTSEQLPAEIFDADLYFPATEREATLKLFKTQLLSDELFLPQRWAASTSRS